MEFLIELWTSSNKVIFIEVFFSKKSISHLTEDDDVYRLKLAGISITLYDTLFRSARTSTIVHSVFKFEN